MKLLNKLIWHDKNKYLIAGGVIGAFIGLSLLLFSIQTYLDIKSVLQGKTGGDDQYVMINKQVTLFNTLGAKSTFAESELEDIKNQSFITDAAFFTSNRYKVNASSTLLGFYTELFFEAVPDEFIDVVSPNWNWQKGQSSLPIIISKDYLALYNFGYAPSQGLPQFTMKTMKNVTIDINISGKGLRKTYKGHIIGFSNRINSILVPENFMSWANETFGESPDKGSSRLILATNNPYEPKLGSYLADNYLEISSGRIIGGQMSNILRSTVTIIAFIGSFIFLMALILFVLNFQLLISRSQKHLSLLFQLGHKTKSIAHLLLRYFYVMIAIVFLLTLLFLLLSRFMMVNWFLEQGVELSSGLHWIVWVCLLVLIGVMVLLNHWNIRKSLVLLE